MLSRIVQSVLLTTVLASPLLAQAPLRMWYRGSFDGWAEHGTQSKLKSWTQSSAAISRSRNCRVRPSPLRLTL